MFSDGIILVDKKKLFFFPLGRRIVVKNNNNTDRKFQYNISITICVYRDFRFK